MKRSYTGISAAICTVMLLSSGSPTLAQTTALQTEAQQTDVLVVQHGTSPVQARMANEFGTFAGSEANAQSLVTGLRTGTAISLQSTSAGGTSSTLTFDPPTRSMGYGNVYISLALAKQQLAGYGITDPTPQQIQAALTGGTIVTGSGATAQTVTLQGVLNQRADGMGWGQIARSQGVNLGQVVSGLRGANASIATGGSTAAGITTATGAATAPPGSAAAAAPRGNSAQAPAYGRSIVTGSGASTASGVVTATGAGGAAATAQSGARAGAAGIVTGAGATTAARGGAGVQGQAKGLLK